MVHVIGFDIGGANTKAASIRTREGSIDELKVASRYFPIWKRGKKGLSNTIEKLRKQLSSSTRLDGVGLTMTAELSDVYRNKKEGVNHILDCVEQVFVDSSLLVLDVDANLISVEEARIEPLRVAAANWAATGWIVSRLLGNCIVIDTGSTTTSIVPIVGGLIAAEGKTDLEKLLNGELVYTGCLRTNVSAIIDSIPIRGGSARVSSELFALSGDIHLILGNISEVEYTTETADGRGKKREEALERLARVVCADVEMLTEQEITCIAEHVYEAQIRQIAHALNQVYSRTELGGKGEVEVVVTGLGRDFLARNAARRAGFTRIVDFGEMIKYDAAIASPSVGVALMMANRMEEIKLGGRPEAWRKSS